MKMEMEMEMEMEIQRGPSVTSLLISLQGTSLLSTSLPWHFWKTKIPPNHLIKRQAPFVQAKIFICIVPIGTYSLPYS